MTETYCSNSVHTFTPDTLAINADSHNNSWSTDFILQMIMQPQ